MLVDDLNTSTKKVKMHHTIKLPDLQFPRWHSPQLESSKQYHNSGDRILMACIKETGFLLFYAVCFSTTDSIE